MKTRLEEEVKSFARVFPGMTVRFCRLMGRRVSHVAGDVSRLHTEECRIPINENLLMFVQGAGEEDKPALEDYAGRLSEKLQPPGYSG